MLKQLNKIAVIGGGSWATANIKMLTDNTMPKEISWWMRNAEAVNYIKNFRHNPHYLSSVEIKIPAENISTDLKTIISHANFVLLNVPAAFLKEALKDITPDDLKGKYIVSAIKGIVPDENKIIGEFLHEKYQVPFHHILVLSGPCHAEEVALEKLSYLTIACKDTALAAAFAGMLSTRYIKTVVSDDIYGTEYGAVLKNIYAIASGICHGVGYGDNFQSVLISNAIRELERFVDVVHPIDRDIKESAYLGDLLVTAYSQFSRNRTFGNMVGKGYTVKSAQLEMNMIAEGYYAVNCLHEVNKQYKVEMPICEAVYAILYKKSPPALEMQKLAEKLS
ncbi:MULTISPECIES: NAD(P)H-dependent glycerol-3-phosphate dehydrogenase [unclassified Mucilaginibacter]|uniref:NAD(P)H-dependent glycerol-3-phosphate dehydrogenase n=1 Tax=unclassified Mucilaginibacter TaxID=2617802 RepID=UPI0009637931|nr:MULTISPECIES: NAD(P)H-dependent glycerol-3-phosphate dehydrogenase [unclassified Mucilaginibacter]OJW15327.1 MAG: glycerol-3-phosphate dehydrogenase [Mucilaginibacter sp. 44-25]PLW90418.1 MAG: glycerol-3-phosphate dehydrogenase [Mucilaginibacter sp.]HEK20192.1 NAD(P)H-dependent glycerol-3-phosphate dehydrogenase [Bacteroidota bacterium]